MKNNDLMSLNKDLYNEFSLEKLEERLETDPLFIANFLAPCGGNEICYENNDCHNNGICHNNSSCYENGTCHNNGSCNING